MSGMPHCNACLYTSKSQESSLYLAAATLHMLADLSPWYSSASRHCSGHTSTSLQPIAERQGRHDSVSFAYRHTSCPRQGKAKQGLASKDIRKMLQQALQRPKPRPTRVCKNLGKSDMPVEILRCALGSLQTNERDRLPNASSMYATACYEAGDRTVLKCNSAFWHANLYCSRVGFTA